MSTDASRIAAEIATRLAGITKAAGYATDIGRTVFRGRRLIPEDAPPCVTIVEADDTPREQQAQHVKLDQTYILEAHGPCDIDNPNDAAHEMIGDLKRAVFSGDRTFGRTVRTLAYRGRTIGPRPDGQAIVAANIVVAVEYAEDLSNP